MAIIMMYTSTRIGIHYRGGAVETGCSCLHHIIGCVTIEYYPHPLRPPPTAPPCNEYPGWDGLLRVRALAVLQRGAGRLPDEAI